jgi:hypothetical protein
MMPSTSRTERGPLEEDPSWPLRRSIWRPAADGKTRRDSEAENATGPPLPSDTPTRGATP